MASRREPEPPWPEPPAELIRYQVDDWVSPAEQAEHSYGDPCRACGAVYRVPRTVASRPSSSTDSYATGKPAANGSIKQGISACATGNRPAARLTAVGQQSYDRNFEVAAQKIRYGKSPTSAEESHYKKLPAGAAQIRDNGNRSDRNTSRSTGKKLYRVFSRGTLNRG